MSQIINNNNYNSKTVSPNISKCYKNYIQAQTHNAKYNILYKKLSVFSKTVFNCVITYFYFF